MVKRWSSGGQAIAKQLLSDGREENPESTQARPLQRLRHHISNSSNFPLSTFHFLLSTFHFPLSPGPRPPAMGTDPSSSLRLRFAPDNGSVPKAPAWCPAPGPLPLAPGPFPLSAFHFPLSTFYFLLSTCPSPNPARQRGFASLLTPHSSPLTPHPSLLSVLLGKGGEPVGVFGLAGAVEYLQGVPDFDGGVELHPGVHLGQVPVQYLFNLIDAVI